MLHSRASLLFVASLAATFAGCFIDGGPFNVEGNGGSAGSNTAGDGGTGGTPTTTPTTSMGGTGGTPTTTPTTSMGGTGGTTTTTGECETGADCDDNNPCTDDHCPNNTCVHDNVPDGPLPDNDPLDCKKPVCKGGMKSFEADTVTIPDTDPNDCKLTYCDGMNPVTQNDNEDEKCGTQPANLCTPKICQAGTCTQVTLADGTVIDPGDTNIAANDNTKDCRDLVCQGGAFVAAPNFYNCADPDTTNCTVPTCDGNGICKTGGGAMQAPIGYDCGGGKKCNAGGQCL
ncbi:MAG: hypothetical protein R3B70_15945 [Polyangiaceae bacterium]